MDMEAFKVQVIDNGAGMSLEDMERVGNRYHTSKCRSVEDLDNLTWYGFRGEALASMVSLSTLVEISSRTRSSVKTHVKLFKHGKDFSVFEAEAARPSAGTTVIICNFFYNMPVRRKRLDAVLEGERIRHRLEAVSLMHPSVSFTLKNDCTGAMMVQLPKARNAYHRFVQIHGLTRAEKLGEISYAHQQFEVTGYLGREGHYNNSLQFLYVNDRLLLKTRIHKLLNLLLRRLSGSNQKNESPEGQSVIRSPKHKRNNELFGVYIINIKCSYSEYDICLEPAKTLIEFKDWDGILLCVEEAVRAFLKRENLMSVLSQDDLDSVCPKVFGARTDKGEDIDKVGQASVCTSTLDCSVGMKLASEFVHRKSTIESDSLESGLRERKDDEAGQLDKNISVNELGKTPHSDVEPETLHIDGKEELILSQPVVSDVPNEQEHALSKEQEAPLSHVTSNCNVNLLHTLIRPIQSDLNCNKKISLSDPFIHKSLQIQDLPQTSRTVVQVPDSGAKCEEKGFAFKRKISLEAGQEISSLKPCRDFVQFIPPKIPRAISCQKLSTFRESGSLDKFRRIYVKSDEKKLTRSHCESMTRLLPVDRLVSNPASFPIHQDDMQAGEVKETKEHEETLSSFQMSPTIPVVKAQNKDKISLAAKLCHLKQHTTKCSEASLCTPKNTAEDKLCVGGGNDGAPETTKNLNHQDSALHVGPDSSCSTDPQLTVNEEDSASSDWIHHYHASVGKTVYVNKMTGLSRYEEPATEETQAQCTSDVTNMAVSVISQMGELVHIIIHVIN